MPSESDHLSLSNRFQVALDRMLTAPEDCAEMIALAAFYLKPRRGRAEDNLCPPIRAGAGGWT